MTDNLDIFATNMAIDAKMVEETKNFRACHWKWTLNMADSDDRQTFTTIGQILEDRIKILPDTNYVFQMEQGDEKQRFHYQGYIGFKNAHWRNSVMETLTVNNRKPWLEKIKGNPKNYIQYCRKLNTRVGNTIYTNIPDEDERLAQMDLFLQYHLIYKDWQMEIVSYYKSLDWMSSRTIWWIHDEEGGAGKSIFIRHLFCSIARKNMIVSSGNMNDTACAIANHIEETKGGPSIVCFSYPRAQGTYHYAAMEQVKDGLFFSGKYVSQTLCFFPPFVIVFSNGVPDQSKLTPDRWIIKHI